MDSHLIAKGAYKHIRDANDDNPNPVLVSAGKAVKTSRQIKDYFLCEPCDGSLSTKGEDYLLRQCVQPDGRFELREQLVRRRPVVKLDNGSCLYRVTDVPGIDLAKLIHFGSSFFWRASAHEWKLGGKAVGRIRLGQWEERFRRYLLGGAFPEKAQLLLLVDSSRVPYDGFTAPTSGENHDWHKYHQAGLTFMLWLGDKMPQGTEYFSMNGSGVVILAPFSSDSLYVKLMSMLKSARDVGRGSV